MFRTIDLPVLASGGVAIDAELFAKPFNRKQA
jgi:hypothetical protein